MFFVSALLQHPMTLDSSMSLSSEIYNTIFPSYQAASSFALRFGLESVKQSKETYANNSLSSALECQQYLCSLFYILSLMLSCLTKRAWLIGWTLLLLVMTCYFFFLLFLTSEWTRQHSVTARLSTLDPDILCIQNKCGHIFPSTASKSLLPSASFLSTSSMPQFFPGEMTPALGRGDLASLPICHAAFQLRCQPWRLQCCCCWDVAYSRTGMAVSHLVQSSCQRQRMPVSDSRSLFLLCVLVCVMHV